MIVCGHGQTASESTRAAVALVCGIILCIAPLLPYDRSGVGTVRESQILVWPSTFLMSGLGIVIVGATLALFWSRKSTVRRFYAGFMVVSATTAATLQLVQLIRLHYGAGLRLTAMSAGSWALAVACVGCLIVAKNGSTFVSGAPGTPGTQRPTSSLPATPRVLVSAILVTGGIMLEWLVAPLAISGAGFVPYGAHARVTDVYGAFAYISYGAIPPQAVAGFGLAITVGIAALACGSRGPQPAGIVAGVAAVAGLDTLARLVAYVHPAATTTVRPIPLLATALTSISLCVVARLIGAEAIGLPSSAVEPQ